jgi:hypothetical protein
MVPSVELGPGDDSVERTETHVAVRVLEEAVDGVEHVVAGQDPLVHAQENEREHVDEGLNHLFDRMEATDVEPVEPARGMVDGVEPPEGWALMHPPVLPIAEEVSQDEHERDLQRAGKMMRP